MKTIQLNLYSFDELEQQAKDKAIAHFRDINLIYDWWDFTYDGFVAVCLHFGIAVVKDTIAFEGFYFQGSGSGFYAEVNLAVLVKAIADKVWTQYTPKLDLKLPLPTIDRRVLKLATAGKLELKPRIIRRNRCYGVTADLGGYPIGEYKRQYDNIYGEIDSLEKWLETIAQKLNKLLFKALEEEYDHLSADNTVAKTIVANDYRFTADGSFARSLELLAAINS